MIELDKWGKKVVAQTTAAEVPAIVKSWRLKGYFYSNKGNKEGFAVKNRRRKQLRQIHDVT